ncbi:ABC-three component system protein [Arthrobacter sp. AZCC_0090]|uniref:ABC-three component system protein n=1 Tax=Arthrobacter sp. AZCC_0090 TaxID=2735881 RepID=UPI00161590C6|nr:ABC-three component system protein [Arthrobacter sp. AZCC_0090]MBB6406183.1 hypothetical protein [Arthrobacter sp. AZCC_0090]
MSKETSSAGVELVELSAPTLLDAETWVPAPTHVTLTPEQLVSIYSDTQWEEFVLEWATTLTSYKKVMRNGGANDHGVDVAGFLTDGGFAAEWDCYQCKHYAAELLPGDAYPEILKIVLGTMAGYYTWPHEYRFVAPRGYGTTLAGVLNSPAKLRSAMKSALTKDRSVLARKLGEHSLEEVLAFLDEADFAGFGSIELHELVTDHQQTRWHSARFGVPLPARSGPDVPAVRPGEDEQRYVAKLLAAYAERHGVSLTPAAAADHEQLGSHYLRQRVAFYSAESLRVFARDSVPVGTFEALQDEIFDGVIDVHDSHPGDGLDRLLQVTQSAHQLAMTANGLLPVVTTRDRTGVCHQLANDDRLSWCRADPQ